jgi:S-DNA-T family DNA segregation ATPase FtsK/SpoIIIE
MRQHGRQAVLPRRPRLDPADLLDVGRPRLDWPRIIWRYRWQFAPVVIAAVVFAAGTYAHTQLGPGLTAVAVVATVAGLGVWLRRFRTSERVYGGSVALAAGAWLIAASVVGPAVRPLPQLLLVAGLGAAVPWWSHRRIRDQIVSNRAQEAWPAIATAAGLAGATLHRRVRTTAGWKASLHLVPGKQVLKDVTGAVARIESGLGVRPGSVRVERDPARADQATLHVVTERPFDQESPHPAVAEGWVAGSRTIREPVPIGLQEDGTATGLTLWTPEGARHVLIGGVQGSGKTVLLNDVIAGVAPCVDALIWYIDVAKGGRAAAPWVDVIDWLATTSSEAKVMLAAAQALISDRAAAGGNVDHHEPTPDAPAVVLIVDEAAALLADDDDAALAATKVAQTGRSEAVGLVVCTQRPTVASLGSGDLRAQLTTSIGLRMRAAADCRFVFGRSADGLDTSVFDAAGTMYIQESPNATPLPVRSHSLYRPADVREVAARFREARPRLEDRVLTATGAAYARRPAAQEVPVETPSDVPDDGVAVPMPRGERMEAMLAAAVDEAMGAPSLPAVPLADLAVGSRPAPTGPIDAVDRAMLDALRAAPDGLQTSQIAEHLPSPAPHRSTIVGRLNGLAAAGLVRRVGKGGASRWHVQP